MRKSLKIFGAVIVVAAGFAIYSQRERILLGVGPAQAATTSPRAFAMPVPIARVVKRSVPIVLEYSARTDSIRSITLQAKVSGYILEQAAADGSDVKKGDLLYRIDPRDYQTALDQANAQAQRDIAALDYARSNADRGMELSRNGNLAKDVEEQRASAARQAEAALVMDKAAIHAAELNLSYTEIRAPYDGRLGRNQAPIGALVNAGSGGLNTLAQLDPLYVTFNPSEGDLARIEDMQAKGEVEADVYLPGADSAPRKGKLTFIDNSVDRTTGTIVARATIENQGDAWLPGQYVRVSLHLGELPDALMAPQAALGSSQLGKYIYLVGKENKVQQRFVTLGPTDGDLVVISKGLTEGDQIIAGNLQKIGPGALVQPIVQ